MRWSIALFVAIISGAFVHVRGQDRPAAAEPARAEYATRFFQELQAVFDKFRNADLQRAFQAASPARCAELLGDWRMVAFLNEDRNLERWFYKSFEEVQGDLSRYTFQGRCDSDRDALDVATRFPVRDSLEDYNSGRIDFDRIVFKVNAPVRAAFDSKARVYTFELPYLYVTGRRNGNDVYSMMAPNASVKYSPDVTNHWDCKTLKASDMAYRFLLCRTAILPRNRAVRNQADDVSQGTLAFVILSDGKEASASVKLAFDDDSATPRRSLASVPKIVDLAGEEFRLVFASRSWEKRIGFATMLADGRMSVPGLSDALRGDYCEWRPQSPSADLLVNDTDKSIGYKLVLSERDSTSLPSIVFEARTSTDFRLGALQCFFRNADSLESLGMDRLLAVLGDHVGIDIR